MKISLRALAFIATFLLLIFLFKSCMSFSSSKKNRQKAPVNKNSEQQTKQKIGRAHV
jgi:PBP1b-binding outer membrane lipoprotein LpoB